MNNKIKYQEYLFILPFIIILDIPFIVFAFKQHSFVYLISIIVSIIIPFLIQIVFRIKPIFFILFSFPILYLSLSFDVLVFDYNSYYNISTWSAVFDTNPEESKEFLGILRPLTFFIGFLQITTYFIYLFLSIKKKKIKYNPKHRKYAFFVILIFAIDLFFGNIINKAYPFGHTLHSFIAYQKQSNLEKKLWNHKQSYHYNATENKEFKTDSLNKTIVVLITESLRRDHLSLYEYSRNTSPKMSKENLVVYTDLISPANQTVNALRRVFSQAEGNNDTLYFAKPSIISAFNEVGYYTSWFSTQSVGKNGESKNSVIAKECDTAVFRNNTHLDDILLADLKQVLNNKNSKKLIFLHVFGVHYLYNHRFPKDFAKFSKIKNSNYKQDQINKYDDAIRFNDSIQYEIIKLLKKQKGEKIFITFSDHGESLFESGPHIQGHGALQPAQVEFNIPFYIWFSDEYKKQHPYIIKNIENQKVKPAINSDFYYSFPYLAGIEFDELKPEKNFFTDKYNRKKKRRVVNSALDLLLYKHLKSTIKTLKK